MGVSEIIVVDADILSVRNLGLLYQLGDASLYYIALTLHYAGFSNGRVSLIKSRTLFLCFFFPVRDH